jgi:hypothetical protein
MDYPDPGEDGSGALIAAVKEINRALFGFSFGGRVFLVN